MISLCIPTYNRLPYLKDCLNSFFDGFKNYPYEVLIADGGSTDGTLEYLHGLDNDNVRIIEQGKLIGITKSYNQIFKIAKGEFICPGNDDAVANADVLIKACKLMENDEQIGIVAPKLLEPTYRNLHGVTKSRMRKYWVLLSKFFMFRKTVLKKMNYLDENYRSYYIDDDSALAALKLGYTTIFTRGIGFIHYRVQDQDTNIAKATNYDITRTNQDLNFLYKKYNDLEIAVNEYLKHSYYKKKRALFYMILCDKMYYDNWTKRFVEKHHDFSMKWFDKFLEKCVIFKDKKYNNLKDFYLAQRYPDEIISTLK